MYLSFYKTHTHARAHTHVHSTHTQENWQAAKLLYILTFFSTPQLLPNLRPSLSQSTTQTVQSDESISQPVGAGLLGYHPPGNISL